MLVEIKKLGKKYNSKSSYAIRDFNIVGNEGEIIGILGHNGAGKSTTIKCITGMHPYEEGTIRIAGHDLAKDPIGAKQNFGYVSDEHILFEKMTGQEYVDFMGDIYGVSIRARKERIKKFQEMFQLGDSIYKPISSYVSCIEKGTPDDVRQWDPYSRAYEHSAEEALSALLAYMDASSLESLQIGTSIIIVPGFQFRIVDVLVTNFHQPQSTLLLLISAFVKGDWERIYEYALKHGFRFLSYGDSSLLFRR